MAREAVLHAFGLLLFVSILPEILGQQNITTGVCTGGTGCGDCVTRHPSCAWCETANFLSDRCDSEYNLQSKGCANITYIEGSLNITKQAALNDAKDSPGGQAVQVSPQEIRVTLKVGEPQTVRLSVRLAEDYPLDLYYLMDLSYSLRPDLLNVGFLGQTLERELKLLTKDLQLGFGSFVDKTVSPFTLKAGECNDACCRDCIPPYSFINQLPLTQDTGSFADRVSELMVSTSLDTPEGGLDALIQVAACKGQIGWRDRARRMIVYATDAGFHMAGDGKLSGITKPNDGLCHLDPVTNEYDKSEDQDYPSIGQINALLQERNIIPVFAVDYSKIALYKAIEDLITGAKVGELASDSLNVVNLVTEQYKAITSVVDIMDTAPANIRVSYKSYCFDEPPVDGQSQCTGVLLQQEISFDVNILATNCAPDGEPQIFTVRPFGFDESMTIIADVICTCDCESEGVRDPTMCDYGNGTLTCGQCVCDEGRYGEQCECDGDSDTDFENMQSCMRQNTTLSPVCQNRGLCICGECICDQPQNPLYNVYGQYCECDNYCDTFRNEPCGGESRGECICDSKTLVRECKCKPEYEGPACQCVTSKRECETISGLLCNGWGNCTCEGRCQCYDNSPFAGDTCDECPTCVGECAAFQDCVLCKVFDIGSYTKEQCDMCTATIELVDDLVNTTDTILCEYPNDNCTIRYTYELQSDGTYLLRVQEERECPRPATGRLLLAGIDWRWLLIGIIVGILVLGILLISLIRLALWFQDRKEYARFEKDRKAALWNDADNPLFKSSTSTFKNPMHGQ